MWPRTLWTRSNDRPMLWYTLYRLRKFYHPFPQTGYDRSLYGRRTWAWIDWPYSDLFGRQVFNASLRSAMMRRIFSRRSPDLY